MAYKVNDTTKDALKLVGGGIVGAGLALLLAPRAGKETRRDIVRLTKTVGSKTDKAVHELADAVTDFADTVGKRATDILHNGEEMTREAKKELLTAMEKGRDTLERQKHRLSRMVG